MPRGGTLSTRLSETLSLLRDRRLLILLLTCAVHWGACAPFHLLFGVFARDAGLPSRITGLAMFAVPCAVTGWLLLSLITNLALRTR